MRKQFNSDGKIAIDLLEPIGDRSPFGAFPARNLNGGVARSAYDVDKLDPAIAELDAGGGRLMVEPTPGVAFDERRIAFLMLARQVIELIEHSGKD